MSDNTPTMRNEFPGLYYIDLKYGKMKIMDSWPYYQAIYAEDEDTDEIAEKLSQALDTEHPKMVRETVKDMRE